MTSASSGLDDLGERSQPSPRDDVVVFEARLVEVLGRWWLDERPAWTEAAWWQTTLCEDVRRLLWLPAGPLLATALAELDRGQTCALAHAGEQLPGLPTPGHAAGWPCACQVVIAAAWEACAAWVAAGSARALVDAVGSEPVVFDVGGGPHQLHDPAREEVAHALRVTVLSAGNRINAARDLAAHPGIVTLVEMATISAWAGRLVVEHLRGLDPGQAAQVAAEVSAKINARLNSGRRPYNSAEVNRIAWAARLRICPETEQQARIRAFVGRQVTIRKESDGMATLIAELGENDTYRIYRRLSSIATALQTDALVMGNPKP